MERRFTILIAERNPRIRRFLQRELIAVGYLVILAENGLDLARIIGREETLDLMILDDELSGLDLPRTVEQLSNRVPPLPFVIYSFSPETMDRSLLGTAAAAVEKTGNIDNLMEAVKGVLRGEHPCRFGASEGRHLKGDVRNFGDPASTMGTFKR